MAANNADPDTPTADAPAHYAAPTNDAPGHENIRFSDAPADTDLRERIEWLIGNAPARLLVDALLLVFAEHERAQVEAARRDALDAVAHEIASSFPINGDLRPDGTADPQATAYVEGLRDGWSIVRDRAARGETRQP